MGSIRWLAVALCAAGAAAAQEADYRAAIFHDPAFSAGAAATPPETFEKVFAEMGVPAARLDADAVCDPARLNTGLCDLLVVPTGAAYPAAGKEALVAFLKGGGDLLCSGGYAFDRLMVREGGAWVPQDGMLRRERLRAADPAAALIPNGGFENGAEGWSAATPETCAVTAEPGCAGAACGRVDNRPAGEGTAWRAVLAVEPGRSYLVGARLKTGPVQGSGYAYMAVYQYAADNSILHFTDFIQKTAASDWQRHETLVDVLPGAARVEFSAGFYRASGTLWLDDATCGVMPREIRINAHYGKPVDGLVVEPDQLMLFSPDQKFEHQYYLYGPDKTVYKGYEATAQLNGTARWIRLEHPGNYFAETVLGALVVHWDGSFPNSVWALFGVENADIFSGEAGMEMLRDALEKMRSGVFDLYFALNTYVKKPAPQKKGTPMPTGGFTFPISWDSGSPCEGIATAKAVIKNTAKVPRTVNINGLTLLLQPDEKRLYEWSDDDCFSFRLGQYFLWEKSMDIGPLIDDPRLPLPTIRTDGDRYLLTRQIGWDLLFDQELDCCLFGTDTYGNMFSSPNQSPYTWADELSLMRLYDLDLFENLQFIPENYTYTPEQWSQIDTLIRLAQHYDLIYMAGLLIGQDVAVSDDELEKQAAMCAEFARRYRDVPGLIYYLNGDFQLKLKDLPDLRRDWNALLRARHGTDAAAREVWKGVAPADGGEIPVTEHAAQGWYDPKARDVAEFKAALIRRWVGRLCDAIRAEDPGQPVTAEYYQRTYNGIDLRLTMEDMDAANIGYFDLPKRDLFKLAATVKWNDMRLVDRMINIGEFGVKTHDAWTPERGGFGYHIRRTPEEYEQLVWWMVHTAMAMGVSKIQNWCWSDDPDRIFPWGLCYNNPLRPKPVLELLCNLRAAADHVPIEHHPAETVFIMPDAWRTGAPEDFAHSTLMNALECLLAAQIPFDTANEAHLPLLLQKPPKWAVMPMAYALSEKSVERLAALAEAGTVLCLSGDPSIGPDGVRIPERLARLCGVKYEGEAAHPTGPPVPVVTPVEAVPVENPCGVPLYRRALGKGAVLWTPEPWETFQGADLFVDAPEITADPARNLLLFLAGQAGVTPPAKLSADGGVWRVMVTPAGGDRLITVFPRSEIISPAKVTVEGKDFTLGMEFRKTWPAMVLLDKEGKVEMATGTGPLSLNGKPVAEGPGAWMIIKWLSGGVTAAATEPGTVLVGGERKLEITHPHESKHTD